MKVQCVAFTPEDVWEFFTERVRPYIRVVASEKGRSSGLVLTTDIKTVQIGFVRSGMLLTVLLFLALRGESPEL